MTKLIILTQNERRRFDSPPMFNAHERALYFSLNNTDLQTVQELRTATNKVGYVLQLGYFRSQGKFFTAEQFRRQDIEYVINTLNIDPNKINLFAYQKKIPADHRKRILSLAHWQPFDQIQQDKIAAHALWLAQRQFSPKHVFLSIIDFCWQNKIELPTYNALALIITHSYNQYENGLIDILSNKLTRYHREKLDKMIGVENNKKRMDRSPLTLIKQINQSLKPSDIQENVKAFQMFQEYFAEYLNASPSTIKKWETGEKHPTGPALKLLNLVAAKGLKILSTTETENIA